MQKVLSYFRAPGRLVRIIKFCLVGGMNYLVDISIFNLLMLGVFLPSLTSKILAAGAVYRFFLDSESVLDVPP